MTAIPAPTIVLPKEEWPDADFDFLDGDPIHTSDAESDKEDVDDEDWDIEMDLGKTGGAKSRSILDGIASRLQSAKQSSQLITIRPPLPASPDDDEDDEGVSTIKVAALPKISSRPPPQLPIDEDFEDAFALPSDLTQLSLRPVSHRSSKASLEWGDKDQTSSSQSSDAYSSLGFADNASSSNYTSASLPETETEEDEEDDGDLDGLVIPTGLFESGSGRKKLAKILETKKKTAFSEDRLKVASPDPEDDFEIGLVIDHDVELSSSRLLQNAQSTKRLLPASIRSRSTPPRPPGVIRPPSRVKSDRAKSPTNPPVSSAQQLKRLATPPSPPSLVQPIRSQTYSQVLVSASPSTQTTFLAPKPGSLRVQKSHSGLKPASPPSTRKLGRKASLPSLSESNNQPQASGSGSGSGATSQVGYVAPTASSRAKMHTTNSASRVYGLEYIVPPTRPSTPSSNPAALRLTMPTSSSRMKARTPVSSVFPVQPNIVVPPVTRSYSPLPPVRPPSASSLRTRYGHSQTQSLPLPAPKVLKRPKRQRTYGDGTELDAFEDLPLDREKEGRYRVQPKGRIPGASYAKAASADLAISKGTLRRRGKRELSSSSSELSRGVAPPAKTLKRTGRIDFPTKSEPLQALGSSRTLEPEIVSKKKVLSSPSSQTRRKPTLIRNLGGANAPKVVGEMKWNPITLRWEGNDQALRDFDAAVGSSTRPALITHLTGSSIGSPVSSFAAGARVVGNMIFDPARMCWISTLPPDEEEPDVFADLADDEDDEDWEAKGGTIRASQQLPGATPSGSTSATEPPSPARSHSRTRSGSESDRCSRASMVCDVDDAFAEMCRLGQERHRAEMKGWLSSARATSHGDPDRSYLYEIRALATRQY
ncbi:uncharacterized protein FIBRA_01001 [Fibroporia radiculosa]|uniref:Protein byr4 n=1 Tax=Fibroporia radiculosa TaxID=599839 RepID=J4G0Q9_9APHY|nr:uncharacterized protein FIBRA_01001 [Fibroporia radiculosa]CCL98993.1 predicted protein [Fibroporia radiculosa]